MAAQKDKLMYFPARARAEAIRMLYAVADKEFEDVRLSGESWEKYKQGRLTSSSLLVPMVTGRVLIVLSEERTAYLSDGLSCGNKPIAIISNDSVFR